MSTMTIETRYSLGERLFSLDNRKPVRVEAIGRNAGGKVFVTLRFEHNGYTSQWDHDLIEASFSRIDPDEHAFQKWELNAKIPDRTFRGAWYDGLKHGRNG